MSKNAFVPGINNTSFDYDARFQKLMDALSMIVDEIRQLRREIAQANLGSYTTNYHTTHLNEQYLYEDENVESQIPNNNNPHLEGLQW